MLYSKTLLIPKLLFPILDPTSLNKLNTSKKIKSCLNETESDFHKLPADQKYFIHSAHPERMPEVYNSVSKNKQYHAEIYSGSGIAGRMDAFYGHSIEANDPQFSIERIQGAICLNTSDRSCILFQDLSNSGNYSRSGMNGPQQAWFKPTDLNITAINENGKFIIVNSNALLNFALQIISSYEKQNELLQRVFKGVGLYADTTSLRNNLKLIHEALADEHDGDLEVEDILEKATNVILKKESQIVRQLAAIIFAPEIQELLSSKPEQQKKVNSVISDLTQLYDVQNVSITPVEKYDPSLHNSNNNSNSNIGTNRF